MQLIAANQMDQLLGDLYYQEATLDICQIEDGISIIPPEDGKGPPDFYFQAENWDRALPLTKRAKTHLGQLSGIKPAIYKEFVNAGPLTTEMIHYSVNRSDRGGVVAMCYTKDAVIGVYDFSKPYMGLHEAFRLFCEAASPSWVASNLNDPLAQEFDFFGVIPGQLDSVSHGVYMCFDGKPKYSTCSMLHDQAFVLGDESGLKRRKKQEAFESSALKTVSSIAEVAPQDSQLIKGLAGDYVDNPVRFLNRLSLMKGVSNKVSDAMSTRVVDFLNSEEATHYNIVRFVANLNSNPEAEEAERRFQHFAHYVATEGGSRCKKCGLPQA